MNSEISQDTKIDIHDMRNYLNRITMQTELIKMLLESDAEKDEVFNSLQHILNASESCSQVLNKMSMASD